MDIGYDTAHIEIESIAPNARTFRSPKPDTVPTSRRRTPLPPTAAPSPSSKHGSKPKARHPTGDVRSGRRGNYRYSRQLSNRMRANT